MDDRSFWEQRIGTTIRDTWRLDKLIGVGGMAAVFVGTQRIGRRDAIKILHPEIARSADLRARFEQEARVLCGFRHPGAVEVFSMGTTDDGLPFLVMELLEGESLADRAKRLNGLPVDEMLAVVDEILDVLAAVHGQGIIHRDIKLDNVFVLHSGRAKLLDFGIARPTGVNNSVQTRLGSMLGTLPYMPPEQIRGRDVDHRADIFSTGAMMFRLLAKRRIHEATNEAEMLIKMSTEPAPLVGTIAKDAPTNVCMIVDRALAFHKERRYPDVLTMQKDVRAVRAGQTPPYAAGKLAQGDAPNQTSAPTQEVWSAPTEAVQGAFHDAPTNYGQPAPKPPSPSLSGLEATRPTSHATNPPTSQPTSQPTSAKPAASIMFAPTMMVSSESVGLAQNTQNAPAPVAPAVSYSALTPPPVTNSIPSSVTANSAQKTERKIPTIAMIIGGVVCLLFLFLAVAMLRGQDDAAGTQQTASEPPAEPSSTVSTESKSGQNAPTKTKGKRKWDKVRW